MGVLRFNPRRGVQNGRAPALGGTDSLDRVRDAAQPLAGAPTDYDPILDLIGNAPYVLLGEASHGTHEFYKARADITKRLIVEKGFSVIAWEADWPDALRVNRYLRGVGSDGTALEALGAFQRFPTWMWRNADTLDMLGWLRAHNDRLSPDSPKVGVYGLDLYSLHRSMHSVIDYLDKVDPEAARQARRRYACFEDFGDDPQSYGLVASADRSLSCEDQVVQQLLEFHNRAGDFLSRDGRKAADELFYAEQNARVAQNAEKYYRAMYRGRPNAWNLRDSHMAEALDRLIGHLEQQGETPKAVVWAHNSHLGDARATEMSRRGELNIGQLVRERHADKVRSVGFTTYTGTVTAAADWDAPAERKTIRRALDGSYEALFHELEIPSFLLTFRGDPSTHPAAGLLERAIGVIYRPDTERLSHYFQANIAEQFDAVIHFDETRAVEPLERTPHWEQGEVPETYPTGI